jgi:hypothetical protein
MCALGELLFYLAAQDQNSGSPSVATINNAVAAGMTSFVFKCFINACHTMNE